MTRLSQHISLKKTFFYFFFFVVLVSIASQSPWSSEKTPWYSVIPPLVAIVLALITHWLFFSLFIAVLLGSFLAKAFPETTLNNSLTAITHIGSMSFKALSDPFNLQVLWFVLAIMLAISCMLASGGLNALMSKLKIFAHSVRSTQFTTFGMGLVLFFDDYTNTMVVGNTIKSVTDRFKISREKLAFLVDATSAPVTGIAILSTWIGYEVGLFEQVSQTLRIGKDGYSMLFDALQFRFYCFFMLSFVFLNILFGIDFGPMAKAQKKAQHSNLNHDTDDSDKNNRAHFLSGLLPLAFLISFIIGGIIIDGKAYEGFHVMKLFQLDYWRQVLSQTDQLVLILALGSTGALLLALFLALFLDRSPTKKIQYGLQSGLKAALLPLFILILAWSLKAICDELGTGEFLALSMKSIIHPVWFPALLFIVSGITSFATGTSWGTMAILIPTTIPAAFHLDGSSYGLITMMSLGAVLDGSIFGDHCSPISDTTIMSSASSSCDLIEHVKTQGPYSILIGILAIFVGYVPVATGLSSLVCFCIAVSLLIVLYIVLRSLSQKTDWIYLVKE